MPSPIISAELRRAWSDLSNSDIQKKLESFGLTVELKNSKSRHFKVSGSIRPVELYASTGTVNAAPLESSARALLVVCIPTAHYLECNLSLKLGINYQGIRHASPNIIKPA